MAIDIRTGGILAMVGGRRFSSRAPSIGPPMPDANRGRPSSPLFTPWPSPTASLRPALCLTHRLSSRGGPNNNQDWRPENFSKRYQGEMTLRQALTHSKNIPAVRLVERLGPSAVVQFAHKLGIDSPLSPNLSIALGERPTAPCWKSPAAFAVFPNGGNPYPAFWCHRYSRTETMPLLLAGQTGHSTRDD